MLVRLEGAVCNAAARAPNNSANVWLAELIRPNAFNGAAEPCTASV